MDTHPYVAKVPDVPRNRRGAGISPAGATTRVAPGIGDATAITTLTVSETMSVASIGHPITLDSSWIRTRTLRRRPTCRATIMAQANDPQGRPLWSPPVSVTQQPSQHQSTT